MARGQTAKARQRLLDADEAYRLNIDYSDYSNWKRWRNHPRLNYMQIHAAYHQHVEAGDPLATERALLA